MLSIRLQGAKLNSLDLSSSRIGNIDADGLIVTNDIRLADGCRINGPACFTGARVGGNITCINSHFSTLKGSGLSNKQANCSQCRECVVSAYGLILNGVKVGGDVHLCGEFISEGGVHLGDSLIAGNLNCTYGQFIAKAQKPDIPKKANGRRLHCKKDCSYHCACALNGEGMEVQGNLLLNDTTILGEARLTRTVVGKDIDAANGTFHNPDGNAIYGDRIQVQGNVFFSDGFVAQGVVRLPKAKIGADLSFFAGRLSICTKDSRCLYCEGITVQGTIYLKKSIADVGYIDFSFSSIGGNLDLTGSTFSNTGDYTIKAQGMNVAGSLFLGSDGENRFTAKALVCLTGSKLGMDLICTNASFSVDKYCPPEKSSHALQADNMAIAGKVELDGEHFQATGGVCLDHTKIGSYLSCSQATFTPPINKEHDHRAISGGKLNVYGSVYLNQGFKATGEVMLNDAIIGRNLVLKESSIFNKGGRSLWAKQMQVKGCVYIDTFESLGKLEIDYAVIDGTLNCKDSRLDNQGSTQVTDNHHNAEPDNYAFRAHGIKVQGSAYFENLKVNGIVSLQHAEINMRFIWRNITEKANFSLFLAAAKVGVLDDDQQSWPNDGHLQLNDFQYHFLEDLKKEHLERRCKEWLSLPKNYRTQPFEHLAAILTKNGHEEEAKKVLIEKNKRSMRLPVHWSRNKEQRQGQNHAQSQSPLTKTYKVIHWLLVSFGYQPSRAIRWGAVIVIVGWLLFGYGFQKNLMVPVTTNDSRTNIYQVAELVDSSSSASDSFHWYALFYSLDTFLPVIQLQTASDWLPTAYPTPGKSTGWGIILCLYRWIHICFGWVISIFYVSALSHFGRK